MILQVQDIIKEAMGVIGETSIDETPTASEMNMCLRVLNMMIGRLSANRLILRSTVTDSLLLTPGVCHYVMSSQVITGLTGYGYFPTSVGKPIKIISAFIRDNNGIDTPVNIIEKQEYDSYIDKSFSSARPYSLNYDPGVTQQVSHYGVLSLYPIPDNTLPYTLFIESDKYLTSLVNLTDTVTFEDAYYEFLVYNLAVRLFRRFNDDSKIMPVDIISIAKSSRETIETMNAVQVTSSMDIPGNVVTYNIFNDTYR